VLFKRDLSCVAVLAFLLEVTARIDVVSDVTIWKLRVAGADLRLCNWKSLLELTALVFVSILI
jgi:hypothetical protein